MVESTLRFGGNALAKGMNLVVDCEDKLENMDRQLTRRGVIS